MFTLNGFKDACSDLLETCERCNYSYELGVASDKQAFLKIYAHKDKMYLGSVVFDSIPQGTSFFVSIDIFKEVPYVYIYPNDLPFKSCL